MKKLIAMLMMFTLMLSSIPASAANKITSEASRPKTMDSITLRFISESLLEEVSNASRTIPDSNDSVVAQKSDINPDVYELPDSHEYVMAVGENQYQMAEKIDLHIREATQIDKLDIPQEIKDTIKRDLADSPSGYIEGTIFAPMTQQTRDIESKMDYTYKGYNMRQYLYTFNNFEATNVNVSKGVKTKERISGGIDFVFTLAATSKKLKVLSPYTTGATLLKDFLAVTQSSDVFATASDDSVYITPHWNRYLKFTYCDYFHDGNYILGLKSICAQLTKVEYDIYFRNVNSGKNEDIVRSYYEYIYSPNYGAPDATAIACAPTEARLEDSLTWNINAKSASGATTELCTVYIS